MKRIMFTGGGSAGHVLPNVAIIEEFLSRGDVDVGYIGTDAIEKNIISKWRIPYFQIHCPKLIRSGGWNAFRRNLQIPRHFFRAVKQAKKGLRAFAPDAVFSKGGYVGLPVVIAAKQLHIPCFAHESDYSLGLANRLSLPFCRCMFTSFPTTAKRLKKGRHSGAPIRKNIFSISKAEARRQLDLPVSAKVILVFGGGSGSIAINTVVRKYAKQLTEKYVLLHVCGKNNIVESTLKNYRQFEFISDMGIMYAAADIIVARAGAGTLFEVLALKKPAIFIPLEQQSRGDQAENAEYFRKQGLCKVLYESELEKLPKTLDETINDETLQTALQRFDCENGTHMIVKTLRSAIE